MTTFVNAQKNFNHKNSVNIRQGLNPRSGGVKTSKLQASMGKHLFLSHFYKTFCNKTNELYVLSLIVIIVAMIVKNKQIFKSKIENTFFLIFLFILRALNRHLKYIIRCKRNEM